MAKANENLTGISPNLLKNFNPYDILEPQKIATLQVDKLIDIDEPISSTCAYKSTEVNASLLDQKPNYELIDLFQNMYVTPQHVKVKETNDILGIIEDDNYNKNVDYTGFFDLVESGKKLDWFKNETAHKSDTEMNLKSKRLVSEDVIDPDDLIDEVLAEKNLEKLYFSKQMTNDDETTMNSTLNSDSLVNEFPKIKMLKTPSINDLKSPTKNIERPIKCTKDEPRVITKQAQMDIDLTAEFPNLKLHNETFININNDKYIPQSFNSKMEGKLINTEFKVIAVKKDAKALRKYYIATPESQKRNFNKGPGFKEKSIVLPQIMSNIINRQAYLEEKKNIKKKLILDFGGKSNTDFKGENIGAKSAAIDKCNLDFPSTSSNTDGKEINKESNATENMSADESTFGRVSPTVLMADCNRERLKAFRQSQLFRQFVMNGE